MEERIELLESDLDYLYKKDIENRAVITKMLENNEKILESLIYHNQEIDKKMSLMFNCIEFLCNKESDVDIHDNCDKKLFCKIAKQEDMTLRCANVFNLAIDIYNCDKKLFCKMIAKQEDMTLRCANVFNLLFFDISYEELNSLLEMASKFNKKGDEYSKWFKLNFLSNLVLQGYSLHKNNNSNYKVFLDKMYKIFNDTDISSCPSPYNSKEQFLRNTIFKICYNEARNML